LAITKGITFTHARSYVEETLRPAGWSQVLAASPRDDRAILGSIVAVGWYDLAAVRAASSNDRRDFRQG